MTNFIIITLRIMYNNTLIINDIMGVDQKFRRRLSINVMLPASMYYLESMLLQNIILDIYRGNSASL